MFRELCRGRLGWGRPRSCQREGEERRDDRDGQRADADTFTVVRTHIYTEEYVLR